MLLSFKVKNYRSFRDEAILDMEAASLKEYNECLIKSGKKSFLPTIAIYGKNGGGKSNIIRALWLGVQFIKSAQRTQHEKALVPVQPFELDDHSRHEPTLFEFNYLQDEIKYTYGFSATKSKIVSEYLYHYPKGQKAMVFSRTQQEFSFPMDNEKKKKEMMKEAVAANQLFFAVSCTMNYQPCIAAMKWFRQSVVFSRDYTDISRYLSEYSEDPDMLHAIVQTAKIADLGIQDIKFEINNLDITKLADIPTDMDDDMKNHIVTALAKLKDALESAPNDAEGKLRVSEIKATSFHVGKSKQGDKTIYPLAFSEESDGTRRLMALAPAMERTLKNGGLFIVDELEREIHPLLMEYIINRYQDKASNPRQAQLVFTTHSTELMSLELLRRDQINFVDKDRVTGASELYSMKEFSPRKDENIHKGYLLGKYGAVPRIEEV
ncbi:ATP/GTP-binding protein [Pelosinus sp. sgz500959]|uniref:AAA family ATPase n=1 Tax=Pelosinus sp. sgz500959 TaxID=3242472 RepID=UPI0036703F60